MLKTLMIIGVFGICTTSTLAAIGVLVTNKVERFGRNPNDTLPPPENNSNPDQQDKLDQEE